MVIVAELAVHGNDPPGLTDTVELFAFPEQDVVPEQFVVGKEQVPETIITEELLKL